MADAASGYRKLTKLIGNLAMPNGVGIAPDGNSIYVSELRKNRNWRCPFDKNNGGLLRLLCLDAFLERQRPRRPEDRREGFVYQASFNSQGIYVIDPNHEIVEFIAHTGGALTPPTLLSDRVKWLLHQPKPNGTMFGRVEVDNVG